MLYQLKRAGIGQHDLVTIYVSVIRHVLEYACPVWHTNLNKHITESIETVRKRALKCIYPGNEGRKEGTCLFDINNHNTEYTTVKLCRETPTKAQSVPLSREPPTCHNTQKIKKY